jgi:hypothetical protein
MRILGFGMKYNQLQHIDESDWVVLRKITPESTEKLNLVTVYKYKNKEIPRAVCWKHEDGLWDVYLALDPTDKRYIVKLDKRVPTKYLQKAVTTILNSSVCGLWTRMGLKLGPLVNKIVDEVVRRGPT